MKRKKIELGKKLFLNKDTIASLSTEAQHQVVGGATLNKGCTISICNDQCPSMACPPTVLGCPPVTSVSCPSFPPQCSAAIMCVG